MATLVNNTGEITIAKQSGTVLTLSTDRKYCDGDIEFVIGVQSGAAAGNTATADAAVESTSGSAGGTNIGGAVGQKTETEPSSGFYLKINATGSGSSKVTGAGWLDTGALASASAQKALYFPVNEGTASVSGTNVVTPSASLAGTNVTLSNTDNGIAVTATGGGSATANASASTVNAGFIASGESIGSAQLNAPAQQTTASLFLSGVTLQAPASGSRSFSVTVPNGSSTLTFTFNVDANGVVTIS